MISEQNKMIQLEWYKLKKIPVYPSYRLSIEKNRGFYTPYHEQDKLEFKTFVKKGGRIMLVKHVHIVNTLQYKDMTPLEVAQIVKEKFDSECAKVFEKGLFNDDVSIEVE